MKKAFLFSLFAFPGLLFAQSAQYVVRGKVGNHSAPVKAYLAFKEGAKNVTDSAILKAGVFEFKGTVKEPVSATLVFDYKGRGFKNIDFRSPQDALGVYLEKGAITISGTDSVSKAKISGSKLNEDSQNLKALLKPVEEKMKSLNQDWSSASEEKRNSPDFNAALQGRYEAIQEEQKGIFKKFILANTQSYVSLDALAAIAGPSPEYSEVEPLFSALSANLKQTGLGKNISASLETGKYTAIGATAKDFTQNDVNGKPVKLSDFKGKYVLLDFWASWCGPCRKENPFVVNVYNKYKDKNFTILGVSLDRPTAKDAWMKAISDDKLSWTHVSDLKYWQNEVAVLYGIQSIPQNFLLDPSGKIIAKNLRGEDLDKKLSEVIK